LDTNIDQQEMLGVDVKADIEYLVAHLQRRADITAGVLQSAKEEIDEIATRAGTDTDADAQKQLVSLKKQRDALAESQRVNVRLMDKYGLETARLRQGIIVATGKLSQDIFDKEVASGLVESWLADSTDWFRSNGASLLFQVLAFVLVLFAFFIAARIGRGLMRRAIDRAGLLHQDDGATDPALRFHHRDCAARRRSRATARRPRHRWLHHRLCLAGHALELRIRDDDSRIPAL
jgi:hypothetical protein